MHQARPILTAVPKEEDLMVLCELAKGARGTMIEQLFILGGVAKFCIQTVVGRRVGEEDPTWYLYSGDNKSKLEWILQTADIHQVMNAIAGITRGGATDANLSTLISAPGSQGLPPGNAERPKVMDPVAAINPRSSIQGVQGAMEGDLSKLSIDSVLNSIQKGRLTGRLECHIRGDKIEAVFENGNARHASSSTAKGEDALVELMTALEGTFKFVPSVSTESRTIFRRTEELTSKAKGLIDLGTFLERAGIKLNTRLKRNHAAISEPEFEAAVSPLVPVDMDIQKRFYQLIDNQSALFEIIEKGSFNRCFWIPTLYNLMSGSLITAEEEVPMPVTSPSQGAMGASGAASLDTSIGIDQAKIEQFARSHIYSDTGIVTFVALLYFIEQEYYRFECFQSPFSLVLVKPRIVRNTPNGPEERPLSVLEHKTAIMDALAHTKRKADLLAHYQQDDFALLLPQTNGEGVQAFAGRLVQAIAPGHSPIGIALAPDETLTMTIGIGSLPEDCQDWVKLVAFLNQNQRRF